VHSVINLIGDIVPSISNVKVDGLDLNVFSVASDPCVKQEDQSCGGSEAITTLPSMTEFV